MWSWKFGRGDYHAKRRMSSLAFVLRSCQVLGREFYLTLQSCVDGAVEIKYCYCSQEVLGIVMC